LGGVTPVEQGKKEMRVGEQRLHGLARFGVPWM
jgi:hypothetical protein